MPSKSKSAGDGGGTRGGGGDQDTSTDPRQIGRGDEPRQPSADLAADGQHSMGGVTTRDDALDLGVDMLPGDPGEAQGPEDAFGPGPKRGDYAERAPVGTFTTVEPNPDYNGPGVVGEDGGVEEIPAVRTVVQSSFTGKKGAGVSGRIAQRGEVAGLKGGVETEDE